MGHRWWRPLPEPYISTWDSFSRVGNFCDYDTVGSGRYGGLNFTESKPFSKPLGFSRYAPEVNLTQAKFTQRCFHRIGGGGVVYHGEETFLAPTRSRSLLRD